MSAKKYQAAIERVAQMHNDALQRLLRRETSLRKMDEAALVDAVVDAVVAVAGTKSLDVGALRWQAAGLMRAGRFRGCCGDATQSRTLRFHMDRFANVYEAASRRKATARLLASPGKGGYAAVGLDVYDQRLFQAYVAIFSKSYDFWSAKLKPAARRGSPTARSRGVVDSSHYYTDFKCLARIDFEGALVGGLVAAGVSWWTGAAVTLPGLIGVVVGGVLSSFLAYLRDDCNVIVPRDPAPPDGGDPGDTGDTGDTGDLS